MNFYLLGTFVIASLILLATPGPDLLAVLGRGISQGRQAAIVAVIGYALGDVVHTTKVRWITGSIFIGLGIRAALPEKSA